MAAHRRHHAAHPRSGRGEVRKLLAAAALSFLAAAGARAQAPAPVPVPVQSEPETIHSDAERDSGNHSIALDFLRTYLDPSYPSDEQFAFWRVKVCPRVWGTTALAAWTIEHRIKQVAQQVGAPVDMADTCKTPNLLVIVSPEPQATLDSLADRVPILVAMQDIKRLTVKYPVQSWYVALVGDYDGHKTVAVESSDGGAPTYKASGNRLESGLRFGLGMATIIVDSRATMGMSLSTLADYAAMAGLSETVQRGYCHPLPTITNLLVKDCPAQYQSGSLTEIDLEALTGLYHSDDAPGLLQRQRIARMMREMMVKGPPAP
jgi:hypothetical protein